MRKGLPFRATKYTGPRFPDVGEDNPKASDHCPLAMELNGQQVFVKGYVYPDGQRYNIKRFVLVADLGTCCFGGQPKLTHMIEVTLRDPHRVEYSYHKLGLGGVLHVDTRLKPLTGLGGVYFQLDADYVR